MGSRIRSLSACFSLLILLSIFAGCAGAPVATPSPSPVPAPSPTVTAATTPPASAASQSPVLQIQWLGQSAFLLTSSRGTKILIDPASASTGYAVTPIQGVDAVLVTHEHGDHNNIAMAAGSPLILRGLSATGWNTVDQTVKDTRVFSVSPGAPVYHDNQQGAQRGRNTIFVIEMDSLRIVHLGDLGHVLTPEIVRATGSIDIVIVPVGGNFTIDAAAATQVVSQISAKIAIPMHYKTSKMRADWPGTGVEPFLEGKKVERPNSNSISLSKATLPPQSTVVVLNYE